MTPDRQPHGCAHVTDGRTYLEPASRVLGDKDSGGLRHTMRCTVCGQVVVSSPALADSPTGRR